MKLDLSVAVSATGLAVATVAVLIIAASAHGGPAEPQREHQPSITATFVWEGK
jgi:hypothetical protein